jgi:transposase
MDPIERYKLILPILQKKKSVKQVHKETGVPMRTLYRYLKRFRAGDGKLENLADKSHAPHSQPKQFAKADKNKVVGYKLQHPHRSSRQIAADMADEQILKISYHSVATILKKRGLTTPFFSTSHPN